MGKFLHLFLGDSAKTEHDEMYNNETTYRKPWVAFTQGYGMSFNKKEVGPTPDWLSLCDYPCDALDWTQIEKIEFDHFPYFEGEPRGFYLLEVPRDDGLFYGDGDKRPEGWYFALYNSSMDSYDYIPVATIDEVNQILLESDIMDYIRESNENEPGSQPCCNCIVDEGGCDVLRVYPMEGYVPPITVRKLGEMTTDDWNSLYSSDSSSYEVFSVISEEEFFNSVLGGAGYIDFYLTGEFEGITTVATCQWDGRELSIAFPLEKPQYPESFSTFLYNSITQNQGLILYIDSTTEPSIKQAIDNNFKIRWSNNENGEIDEPML